MRAFLMTVAMFMATLATPALAETAFAPGQVWMLKDPAYASVRVTIGKVEMMGEDTVVHISMAGVPITLPSGETVLSPVGHMPFGEKALRQSVNVMVASDGPVDTHFADGYQQWKDAHGGYFTITVPEAIGVVIKAMHQAQSPDKPAA